MELVLARQSVIIKCSIKASTMLGNYEFYYAGGLLCRLAGQIPAKSLTPQEFYTYLTPLFQSYKPQNEQEAWLLKLLKEYRAEEDYDDQMPALMQMGLKEKNMWVRVPE